MNIRNKMTLEFALCNIRVHKSKLKVVKVGEHSQPYLLALFHFGNGAQGIAIENRLQKKKKKCFH